MFFCWMFELGHTVCSYRVKGHGKNHTIVQIQYEDSIWFAGVLAYLISISPVHRFIIVCFIKLSSASRNAGIKKRFAVKRLSEPISAKALAGPETCDAHRQQKPSDPEQVLLKTNMFQVQYTLTSKLNKKRLWATAFRQTLSNLQVLSVERITSLLSSIYDRLGKEMLSFM